MLALSIMNYGILSAQNDDPPPPKRRRYLIINEEIYIEDRKCLIPITKDEYNRDTGSTNLKIQASSSSSKKCDEVSLALNHENSVSQNEHCSDRNYKDPAISQTSLTNNFENDGSDEMVIISDEEAQKDTCCANLTNLELLSNSEKCDEIETLPNSDKTVSQIDERSKTNCEALATIQTDWMDDDSSDELFICEDEQFSKKESSADDASLNVKLSENSELNTNLEAGKTENSSCAEVKTPSNQEESVSQNNDLSESNLEDDATIQSVQIDDNDSSDELIIISDDERSLKKERAYDSPLNMSSLVKLFEKGEYNQNSISDKSEHSVVNAQDNASESIEKPVQQNFKDRHSAPFDVSKVGAMDHFPVFFNKKVSVLTSGDQKSGSSSSLLECPYCSFKVRKGKITRHLLWIHVQSGYCDKCRVVRTSHRVMNCCANRKNDVHVLRCVLCKFEDDNMERFRKHVTTSHLDALHRQCGICAEWMVKNKQLDVQIGYLVEHVKLNHLLPPDEKAGQAVLESGVV